ncbi:hypothetical protein RJ639_028481 [Escallonia herrerae]|uniref:Uncharacterized protein n=1 Tax=Escallonia herrerae TaxID=1293975 RepID=A0AA89BRE5_9ASTE|nr:hypothetical protein RJ639_028481 [Escallonia herrerae]
MDVDLITVAAADRFFSAMHGRPLLVCGAHGDHEAVSSCTQQPYSLKTWPFTGAPCSVPAFPSDDLSFIGSTCLFKGKVVAAVGLETMVGLHARVAVEDQAVGHDGGNGVGVVAEEGGKAKALVAVVVGVRKEQSVVCSNSFSITRMSSMKSRRQSNCQLSVSHPSGISRISGRPCNMRSQFNDAISWYSLVPLLLNFMVPLVLFADLNSGVH